MEPYDGEDELHPEGLSHSRSGSRARGVAAPPDAARSGDSLHACRPHPGEDLPRRADAGPAVRSPGFRFDTAEHPGTVDVGRRAVPNATVTRTDGPARTGPGAPDARPGSIRRSGRRRSIGHGGRSGPGHG
ncbi:hypothetical protein [Arthrobacter sp. TE12232]